MREQTGKVPGGNTGLCHLVVLGAVTGASIDWGQVHKLRGQDREHSVGLEHDMVWVSKATALTKAVSALAVTDQLSIDAVVVDGQMKGTIGDSGRHMAAVLPTAGSTFHVVDSQLPGATQELEDIGAVVSFLQMRFEPTDWNVRVIPTENERMRRRRKVTLRGRDEIQVAEGVYVYVPVLKEPEIQ